MDFPADVSSVTPMAKKLARVKNVPELGTHGTSSASQPAQVCSLPTLPYFKSLLHRWKILAVSPSASSTTSICCARPPAHARTRQSAAPHASMRRTTLTTVHSAIFPSSSLLNDARVRPNPGPDFAFPPTQSSALSAKMGGNFWVCVDAPSYRPRGGSTAFLSTERVTHPYRDLPNVHNLVDA